MLIATCRRTVLAAATVLIGGLLGVVPAQAVEPDIDPPVITEFTATPNPVDLSDGDATLIVRMKLTDPSGLRNGPIAGLHSETTSQSRTGFFRLVDGTNEDGTWQADIEIPGASARGAWTLLVSSVIDTLGNRAPTHYLDVTVGPGGVLKAETPKITGTPEVDHVVTADPGEWGPSPVNLTYQWLRDGSAIEEETDASYRLSVSDLGREISLRVSGSKQMFDDASRTSDPVTVQPAHFNEDQSQEQHGVSANGTHRVGQTLTADPGTWRPEPETFIYQWLRDGVAIVEATAASYQLGVADLDREVTVRVTGSKHGYRDESRTSSPYYRVEAGWLTLPRSIEISGNWSLGGTISAEPGVWGPGTVLLAYQWYRDGQPIAGATAPTYTLTIDDAGKWISVSVGGSKPGYSSSWAHGGGQLALGALTPPASVTILGTPETDQTMTVNPGSWNHDGVTFTYEWYRGGPVIAGVPNGKIEGVTGPSYKLTPQDVNHAIQVFVYGSKPGYEGAVTGTQPVEVRPATLIHSTPELGGIMASGQTLTVDPGRWTSGVKFTYQWMRNGQDIPGANKPTYKLTSSDVGKEVRVYMTAEKLGYTPSFLNWQSAPAAKVMMATTPKVTGTMSVGSTLKLSKGSWTSGTKFAYQWLRDGKAIKKATKTSYKLTSSDAAQTITVRVTGEKSGYETVALASADPVKVVKAATPKISGTKKVGKTLTAKPGSWSAGTTFTYQWYANGKTIKGATAQKLTLAKAQKTKKITVKVTGSQPGYAKIAKTSAKTTKVK